MIITVKKVTSIIGLIASLFLFQNTYAQKIVKLLSPDHHLVVNVYIQSHQLYYDINYRHQSVSKNTLAFQLGGKVYGNDIASIKVLHKEKISRSLELRGNHPIAKIDKQRYSMAVQSLNEGLNFSLMMNVYNNGVAVRYEVQHHNNQLEKDLSTIQFPEEVTYWWQGNVEEYEGTYSHSSIDEFKDSATVGMPLTVSYADHMYAAVMESNLHDFVGSYLMFEKEKKLFNYTLAGAVTPVTKKVMKSSWRIITVSNDLNGLVNNDIVSDVSANPDKLLFPDGIHSSWIKPGMAVWSWMSNKREVTPSNMRLFTDYAAQMHAAYNLIDDGWASWQSPDTSKWAYLADQVKYAASKNVGIWVWKAYPNYKHTEGLKDAAYMEKFFQKCASVGVKGVKIDFINSERQPEIAFYYRAAAMAAKYHLMLDFHGADKATGLEYSYPNILSQEGVRGLEYEGNVNWPFHNTVLPFTRYLSGPADFTPMSFRSFVRTTTLAHQAATVAIYTSPFLCLGADPADLLHSEALPFIRNMPVTWDETIVLKESKIGKTAVFARRKDNTWYLAITNGETATKLDIPLTFLAKRINFNLKALIDTKDRGAKVITEQSINKKSTLHIGMPSGGGYLGILTIK